MRKSFFLLTLACLMGLTSWAQEVVNIGTAEELAAFAKRVNGGEKGLCAVLTADIDLTGKNCPNIGTSSNHFEGVFDGQYHRLTIDATATSAGDSFFTGLAGTVKNTHFDGVLHTSINKCGGIAGELFGATIQNCWCSVQIVSSFAGDSAYGGIASRASATGCRILNTVFDGAILAEKAYNLGGIVGFVATTSSIEISNCVMAGDIQALDPEPTGNPSYTIVRNNGTAVLKNCFYVHPWMNLNENTTQITEEQLASGEICYLLNGTQADVQWYQTLGENPFPVPLPICQQVFGVGNLNCAGQSVDGSPLTYSNTNSTPMPPHHYENGICTECGQSDPSSVELVDGYYLLGTSDQLAWFANKVNQGDNSVNAKLTADIDFSAYPSVTIGSTSHSFDGIFDGQGHRITLGVVRDNEEYAVLFRTIGAPGVVKNLTTDGTITTNRKHAAGICGQLYGRLINCATFATIDSSISGDGTYGGLTVRTYDGCSIETCLSAIKIKASGAIKCGGMVGWLDGSTPFTNCLCVAEMEISDVSTSDAICRNNSKVAASSSDNYFLNLYGTVKDTYFTQITAEQLASGEICYLMNGNQSAIKWYQKLGEDDYPSLDPERGVVYKVHNTMGNASGAEGFEAFRKEVLANEQKYCEKVSAQQTLVEVYAEALTALEQCSDIKSFIDMYNTDLYPLCEAVVESENAYTAYQTKVNETIAYLEEHSELSNVKIDELRNYLTKPEEPSELYPNGTAPYILENCALTIEEITAETAKVDDMLTEAILYTPTAGNDVTKLLTNPDFADGFTGWSGQLGTGYGTSTDNTMRAAECLNATMDMYQTLTGLSNGIYELQVNGAFRPYPAEDQNNTNYAAMLYVNGNCNFFQTNIEGMIPIAEAEDGVNCHITGDAPDVAVEDIEGNVIGYSLQGVISCCNAFSAGRYPNSVLVNVTDGNLTVGIKQPGTGQQPDWLGFGNIQLIYHGTLEEATAGLDHTLASMSDRANTLLNIYEPSVSVDYASYPNFSQALKDQLKETLAAADAATDNAEKYKLIETYSSLFQQIYDCKKAYINLMDQSEKLASMAAEIGASLSDAELEEMNDLIAYLANAYLDGTATIEEALKDYTPTLSFVPTLVDDVYQIGNLAQLVWFVDRVNSGDNQINGALTADIDLTDQPTFVIGSTTYSFDGIFDGQGHKITLGLVSPGTEYTALFAQVGASGVIKNLTTDGAITTSKKHAAGIVARLYGRLINCATFATINSGISGDGTYGGLVTRTYAGSTIESCLSAIKIEAPNAIKCGGMVGWLEGATKIINSLCIAEMELSDVSTSDAICRNSGSTTGDSGNNYFLNLYGSVNSLYFNQITPEQLASGEICYLLNGDQSDIHWYQTLGEDEIPVLDSTHKQLYAQGNLNCLGQSIDGTPLTYSNTNTTPIPDHQYEGGFCVVCGRIDPDACQMVDGFYQVGTAEELAWFAGKVNSGDNKINCLLTADIDFSAYPATEIGTATLTYDGVFDGQGHKITLGIVRDNVEYAVLFRTIGATGLVKNLITDGTITTNKKHAAGISGQLYGRLENCATYATINSNLVGDGTYGGLTVRTYAGCSIENCLSAIKIDAPDVIKCGGMVGWLDGTTVIKNSLCIAEINLSDTSTSDAICRNNGSMSADSGNNYYLNKYGSVNGSYFTQVTAEQLANGEVLALLNEGQEVAQWTQKEGQANPIPFPAGTGIEETVAGSAKTNNNNAIYNLMGQKVQKAQKGIYIIGGKKVLVK